MELNYVTIEYAITAHEKAIKISGGLSGVKTIANIESPLNHIKNDDYYPSFEEKLTHLVFCINKFHGFHDGNKRASIAIGAFFLIINGLDVFVNKFLIEMENIAVAVADNLIDKPLLYDIIFSIINEEEYNEELKLRIIQALSQAPDIHKKLSYGTDFYFEICY